MAIVGFDDDEFSRYVLPALTTVAVPFAQMAVAAPNQLVHTLGSTVPERDAEGFDCEETFI